MSKNKKVFLTNHSKERFGERTGYDPSQYSKIASTAFKKGLGFSRFNGAMSDFLKALNFGDGRYVAKVYDGKVFIFNNSFGHRLLTVYSVPAELLPVDQYVIPQEELTPCCIILLDKNGCDDYYWSEFGPTKNLEDAVEFKSKVKANNYITNNRDLSKYLNDYNIELF